MATDTRDAKGVGRAAPRLRGAQGRPDREPMKRLSILIADRTPEFCAHVARWLREHDTTCVQSTDKFS